MNNETSADLALDETGVHARGDSLLLGLIGAGLPVALAIGYQFDRVAHALWAGSTLVVAAGALWLFARGTFFARIEYARSRQRRVAK